VRQVPHGGDRVLIMAEHLPNEWWWSTGDRPLDTQWNDNFHDRFEDACKGWDVMPALAEAFRITHTQCDDWYDATNYSESHDEVGNENDRITNVAGPGRGLRMSKVAAAGTLLSRGIPMFFMGEESAEWRQFRNDVLDLDFHLGDAARGKVRGWWKTLCELRRNSSSLRGPAPLDIRYAQNQMLGFTRGQAADYYVLLNFGGWSGYKSLTELNLPDGTYRERLNSTWPAFSSEGESEDEHTNGGGDARLDRGRWLHVPDYGVVVLERA
jgi:1,4-alpha-glucan branching enzyme